MYLIVLMLLACASLNAQAPKPQPLTAPQQQTTAVDSSQQLLTAIKNGDIDGIKTSFAQGADPNAGSGLQNPLVLALTHSGITNPVRLNIATVLIAHGAIPDSPELLRQAIFHPQPAMVKLLLPKTKLTSLDLTNFLTLAISIPSVDIVHQLLEYGANPQTFSPNYVTNVSPGSESLKGITTAEQFVEAGMKNLTESEQKITNKLAKWKRLEQRIEKKA